MEHFLTRIALVVLIVVKVAVIVVYGPLLQPDSAGYVTFADTMLSSTQWLIDRPDTMGEDAYRMAGYPALIALSKVAFGEAGWAYAILVLQAVAGTFAAIMVFRFARQALQDWRWALAVAAAFATSQALVYDALILTDALYGNLIAILIAVLGLRSLRQETGRWAMVLAAGLLVGMFLLREFTQFLLPVFLPLIAVAAWSPGRGLIRCAIICVAVVLPTIAVSSLYSGWNEMRSGTKFLTTGARTAALLPLVQFEGRGTPVFTGDSILDVAARENLSSYFYADVLEINRALFRAGVSGVEMSELARERFVETFFAHPEAFLNHAAGEIRLDSRAKALANPMTSFRDLQAFGVGDARLSFSRLRAQAFQAGTATAIAPVIVEALGIVSMFAVAVFGVVVFPLLYLGRLLIRRDHPLVWHVQAGIWASYAGTIAAYSLIRLEDRYLIGFGPFMIVIGLLTMQALWTLRGSISRR